MPGRRPRQLHHVGVVVPEFGAVGHVLGTVLGVGLAEPEAYPELGIEVLWAHAGPVPIELIRPLGEDSRAAALLRAGGGGVHHVAFAVDDLDAALEEARAAGVVLRDAVPRPGTHGSRIAFLDPASAGGTLIELIEPSKLP
jgi:methylmalonyl-CoA/ethylmalonyl-CoA epimerase